MPVRIAMTGQMAGPDVGELMNVLGLEDGECKVAGFKKLYERMDILRHSLPDM
jgi:Anticodon binding domain